MQVRRSLRLLAQEPPLHPSCDAVRRVGAMKLKRIVLAIMLMWMIGLAGCVDAPGYYGSYGYPSYGYYYGGPWWGREGFRHDGRFDHDRFDGHAFGNHAFGGAGFHNGPVFAHGGG